MRKYITLIILLCIDALLVLAHIFLRGKLGFFNLDKEQSLKAAYSGFQLLAAGGVAALYAWLLFRSVGRRVLRILWILVAAGFFYLGIDDMMAIHERIGFVLNRWTGLMGYWGESFNWMIYFAPLIAAALIVYFFLIRSVWRENKDVAHLIIAGTFFFVVSIMMEAIGGAILGKPFYQTSIIVEEGAQLIGESFFLTGVILLLRERFDKMYIITS